MEVIDFLLYNNNFHSIFYFHQLNFITYSYFFVMFFVNHLNFCHYIFIITNVNFIIFIRRLYHYYNLNKFFYFNVFPLPTFDLLIVFIYFLLIDGEFCLLFIVIFIFCSFLSLSLMSWIYFLPCVMFVYGWVVAKFVTISYRFLL